ncbi:hypothetical protein GUJ93_ZPchr0004g39975 [Zizania palustris]|uniref:SET domain-containing protein n=1 Tax=Zizania palustris TaxID=103762 RepID=A0A8J5SE52_ZIZPA|nr:hypothetical protein GUJ93_ZPchr0004g39975 [Zizania palustris]
MSDRFLHDSLPLVPLCGHVASFLGSFVNLKNITLQQQVIENGNGDESAEISEHVGGPNTGNRALRHCPARQITALPLLLMQSSSSYLTEETSDIRAALRLLYFLEIHDLLSSDSINNSSRIGGLSANGIKEVLEEGGEIAEMMLEGSLWMLSARKLRIQITVGLSDELTIERVALWAVMTNGVEVQISEGQALGIAVYGPSFSWFNHSCCPNASYRFVLSPWNEDCTSDKPESYVVPVSKGAAPDAWHACQYQEDGSIHAQCRYGPRVVVRCTKPINDGEEVFITYIDLLQIREARLSDLWSKYKFVCSCNRCTALPQPYVDLILNCDARNLNSPEDAVTGPAIEDLDNVIQQAISEYSFGGDPKSCCDIIETKRDSVQYHQFRSTCEKFGNHMLSLSLQCWPFLAQSLACLEKIKNPIEFSWLGPAVFQSVQLSDEDSAKLSCTHGPSVLMEGQKDCVLRLAVCCITYSKYLAGICYGPKHYLTDRAKDMLECINLVQ